MEAKKNEKQPTNEKKCFGGNGRPAEATSCTTVINMFNLQTPRISSRKSSLLATTEV